MPRIRFPKQKYLTENDELKEQIQALLNTIKAVLEYHTALDFMEVTSKKADQMRVVKQKKSEFDFCVENVADLLAD